MKLLTLILSFGFLYAQPPSVWWDSATKSQQETVLWYTRNYGVVIGAKCVLETSGGKYLDHGEDSYGDLGIYLPGARKRRPGLSDNVLRDLLTTNRHFQGQLAQEINGENLKSMRNKQRPGLCAAMVYPGWWNWNNPGRLNRGLLDLQWQMFLRSLGWK